MASGAPRVTTRSRRASSLATITLLFTLATVTGTPLAPRDAVSARSASGQFAVFADRAELSGRSALDFTGLPGHRRLEPSLLAVSCERIKQALANELGPGGPWRGKILLTLRAARTADDEITVVAERFRDGWNYRLDVPNPVERERLVRGIIQVTLLEQANRNAGDRCAELPLWLREGLTAQLLASRDLELVLQSPQWAVNRVTINPTAFEARRSDPLEAARRTLRGHAPLTLDELSWPSAELLAGPGADTFRHSAQLFLTELQSLETGRAALRATLGELAQCFNWQTAFFHAFKTQFPRPLDLEKWWELQRSHFTGHAAGQRWTPEESWLRLDQIVRATVEVRRATNDLPAWLEAPLAVVVREWDFPRQSQVLRDRARQLEQARMRVAPEFIALVEEYRRLLTAYLDKRAEAGQAATDSRAAPPGVKGLVRELLKQLDALEERRLAMQPRPGASPSGK